MYGPINVEVRSNIVNYEFTLNRKITVLRGDSGTGKTNLIRLLNQYRRNSGAVRVICNHKIIGVGSENSADVFDIINKNHECIIVLDEDAINVITMSVLAREIFESDNYYLLITRDKIDTFPVGVTEIYKLVYDGKVNRFDNLSSQR
jgi:AAA+ superfamily predicted ATPase